MSTQITEYKEHKFQKTWDDFENAVKNIGVENKEIKLDIEKIICLKKMTIFIGKLIEGIDSELMHLPAWSDFENKCEECLAEIHKYNDSSDIQFVENTNSLTDDLFHCIFTLAIFSKKIAGAVQNALIVYEREIPSVLKAFKEDADRYKEIVENIEEQYKHHKNNFDSYEENIKLQFEKSETVVEKINELEKKCFEDTENKASLESRIDGFYENIETQVTGIKDYYKEVMVDDDGHNSIQSQIELAKSKAENNSELINQILIDFTKKQVDISADYDNLKEVAEKINKLEERYFEGTENEDSLESKIDGFCEKLETQVAQINNYYENVIDSGDNNSIKSQIELAKSEAEANAESINQLLSDAKLKLEEVESLHRKMLMQQETDKEISNTLKNDINEKKKEFQTFWEAQNVISNTYNKTINKILSAATNAGLAGAYSIMRESFNEPIKIFSNIFYCALAMLILFSFVSTIDYFNYSPFNVKFIDVIDYKNLLKNIYRKLPIILPIIWLALFVSKRRSEAQRLQQEYAHKEALTMSYEGFKNQIDALKSDQKEELLEKLLRATIDTVAFNACETLDKNHGDKIPLHEGVEKGLAIIKSKD